VISARQAGFWGVSADLRDSCRREISVNMLFGLGFRVQGEISVNMLFGLGFRVQGEISVNMQFGLGFRVQGEISVNVQFGFGRRVQGLGFRGFRQLLVVNWGKKSTPLSSSRGKDLALLSLGFGRGFRAYLENRDHCFPQGPKRINLVSKQVDVMTSLSAVLPLQTWVVGTAHDAEGRRRR
jgi:hypothetical protein